MVELVVFDFDGVIVDSEPLHFEAVRKTLEEVKVALSWEEYCHKYLGYSDMEVFPAVLTDVGRSWQKEDIEDLVVKKAAQFARLSQNHTIIFPGVTELLEELQKSNIPAAICSGALQSEIEMMLAGSGLRKYFTTIVAADDVEMGKPNPEGYRLSMELTKRQLSKNMSSEQCVAIEDSTWGIQAAKEAGMACVAVTNSYPAEELTAADMVVKSLSEISCGLLHGLVV